MPIYEYRCPKCQKVFEEWSHITEDHPEEPCPDCGTSSPRIMSSTSFVLEGGGWYVTDYGYRKGVKDEKKDTSSGSAPAAKASDNTATAGSTDAKDNGSSAAGAASSDTKPSTSTTKAQ